MSSISFRITGGTDVGLERSNNEDNFIINADLSKDDWFIPANQGSAIELGENGCVFVVADGMGGMNAGEVASAIAVDTVKELFSVGNLQDTIVTDDRIAAFMCNVVEEADKRIKIRQKEDESTHGMGTTIVMAWVVKDRVHLCWCGDSRAYLFNKASGLVRLSKDHSYVQELVDEGKLDPELAFDHPNSNIITRSLGDSRTSVDPDYMSRRIVAGDQILLCSDGLCGLCRDEEMLEVFNSGCANIVELKNKLIQSALNAGGYDNVTLVLFETVSSDTAENDSVNETFIDIEGEIRKEKGNNFKKNLLRNSLLLAVLVLGIFLYLGREDKTSTEDAVLPTVENGLVEPVEDTSIIQVTSVTIDPKSKDIEKDSVFTFEAIISPDNATNKKVSWKSTNKAVAIVDNGKVRAIDLGEATIIVVSVDGGQIDSCRVNVIAPAKRSGKSSEAGRRKETERVPVDSIGIGIGSKLEVKAGSKEPLGVTIYPSNASDKKFKVTSDNENVVECKVDGDGIIVIGKAVGTANITVTTSDGEKKDTRRVEVYE